MLSQHSIFFLPLSIRQPNLLSVSVNISVPDISCDDIMWYEPFVFGFLHAP